MPLVRVSLRRGKPVAYRKAILEGVYRAIRATFEVPEGDRFMVLTEHDEGDLVYDPHYLGISRSDDFLVIQLTVSNTRSVAQKKALFRRIVAELKESPGLRPEDVFINLLEVERANWSFGRGIAQYVESDGAE